ncbi:uncharacterized protein cubi_02339 [Cryptosporidium ubiquitum]|uniref:RRM domain-containing protein n=1 Tax=Cryptosporidium ubiquitum TaxID=857276 RepID=A0A1J4MJA9_9CRYT|nr:uncharacterized protein cubi_02339 [Cryptosporidium ubiquitum]OII73108.1 hypothetical protein cubi_02339 [Cryptosporidium ubiquitum]
MDGKNTTRETSSNQSNYNVNKTVYLNNLNDRVSIHKQKIALEQIFAKYGKIESIKIFNSYFRKGQAWVTFLNIESAVSAVKNENGTQLFGKHVNVSFAVKESEYRNITICSCNSTPPMIPKSISTRIELYRQYLTQWLKNAENNGFLQPLDKPEKNKIKILSSQILYDTNYANLIRSNKYKQISAQFFLNNEPAVNSLKRKPEIHVEDAPSFRYNKFSSSTVPQEISNTVFVQIEMGLCKEEDLYILFSHINGFRELRFIPVSFKSYLTV